MATGIVVPGMDGVKPVKPLEDTARQCRPRRWITVLSSSATVLSRKRRPWPGTTGCLLLAPPGRQARYAKPAK